MSTITGTTVTTGVTFGLNGISSPLTITSTGTVKNAAGVAVYAAAAYANPVLVNLGMIAASGGFRGVDLRNGGNVTNGGGGPSAGSGGAAMTAGLSPATAMYCRSASSRMRL